MVRPPLVLVLLALAAAPALADDVTLRNGKVVTGLAREEGDRIVVELPFGTVAYSRDEVVTILKAETPMHVYRDRLEKIRASRDPRDWESLLAYAKEQGLHRYVGALSAKLLELEPGNASGLREQGRAPQDPPSPKKTPPAKPAGDPHAGQVLYDGKWMLPLEAELLKSKGLDRWEKEILLPRRPTIAEPRKPQPVRVARRLEPAWDPMLRPFGIPGAVEYRILPLGLSMEPERPNYRVWYRRHSSWGGDCGDDLWALWALNGRSFGPAPVRPSSNGPFQ